MKCAADFRKLARNALKGKWAMAVIVCLLAGLLGGTGGGLELELERQDGNPVFQISYAGNTLFETSGPDSLQMLLITGAVFYVLLGVLFYLALSIFLGSVIGLGYARFNLNLVDGKEAAYADLFGYFPHWKNAVVARLLKNVTVILGFLLLIVPGLLASYNFALVEFLLAENPDLPAKEALARSRFLMRGNRWRLFCLEFSFIGWQILSSFVWGIGSLWINPYTKAARTAFYREISESWISEAAFAEPISDTDTVG